MRTIISTLTKTTIVLTGLSLASSALARPEGGDRGKRGAPPQAIEACADKTVDQACEFNGRRGTVAGICFTPSEDNSELVCKPEGHNERSRPNTRD